MALSLASYATIVFDCDGVILNSNAVKTRAFYDTAIEFGESEASALVAFHKAHGGVSRWRKFEYFQTEVLKRPPNGDAVSTLVAAYAAHVQRALAGCEVTDRLADLRAATPHARWIIVSGGDEQELRQVFATKALSDFFDGGIFGSPASKDEIFARLDDSGVLSKPAVFLGDSRYDHEAAARAGLDFIFVSAWSEFEAWRTYTGYNQLPVVTHLAGLLASG